MSDSIHEILSEFLQESKSLVEEAGGILEKIEGDPQMAPRLLDYANRVDRIMGAAKSLAVGLPASHALHLLGDYTGVCKLVGTRGAEVTRERPQLFDVTVSFLMDANELLLELLPRLEEPSEAIKASMGETFVDRLRWLSDLYGKTGAPGEASPKPGIAPGAGMSQSEIDELLKKLGV